MFGIGIQELLVILAICVLIFGARRLPEIGSGLGKAIKNFKTGRLGQGRDRRHPREEEGERGRALLGSRRPFGRRLAAGACAEAASSAGGRARRGSGHGGERRAFDRKGPRARREARRAPPARARSRSARGSARRARGRCARARPRASAGSSSRSEPLGQLGAEPGRGDFEGGSRRVADAQARHGAGLRRSSARIAQLAGHDDEGPRPEVLDVADPQRAELESLRSRPPGSGRRPRWERARPGARS